MFITENLIDVGVASTIETYGDVYPDNQAYMTEVQSMKDSGLIVSREVNEITETIFLVKTTFRDTTAYTDYSANPEVAKMVTWIKEHITILSSNTAEA